MEVVIDSNVLFKTLISTGNILDIIFDSNLKLYAPLKLKEEFLNNKEEIISKSNLSESDFNSLADLIFKRIRFIPFDEYKECIPKAEKLLKEHEKDEDFVALALSRDIKIWTYESLLFSLELAISTKQISEIFSKL